MLDAPTWKYHVTRDGRRYRYRIKSTGGSSAQYGPCEVCNQHASEVFLQVEECEYHNPITNNPHSWTRHKCSDLCGHFECLVSRRRGQPEEENA